MNGIEPNQAKACQRLKRLRMRSKFSRAGLHSTYQRRYVHYAHQRPPIFCHPLPSGLHPCSSDICGEASYTTTRRFNRPELARVTRNNATIITVIRVITNSEVTAANHGPRHAWHARVAIASAGTIETVRVRCTLFLKNLISLLSGKESSPRPQSPSDWLPIQGCVFNALYLSQG